MNLVKKIFKNLLLLIIVLFVSYSFSVTYISYNIYEIFFPPSPAGGFFGYEAIGSFIVGFLMAYVLFTSFIFSTWGDKYRYWWILILSIPVVYFVYSIDLPNGWVEVLLIGIGIGLGEGLRKLLSKSK